MSFFQNYIHKGNISKDSLAIIFGKILELNGFLIEYKSNLTPYERCYCLLEMFRFYNFTNEIEHSKSIMETFFQTEKYEFFYISIELLNNNLRFNNHLIDIKYKDGEKLFNEAKEEIIKFYCIY